MLLAYSKIQQSLSFFFFNDTATTEIYTLSLHDALPISRHVGREPSGRAGELVQAAVERGARPHVPLAGLQRSAPTRSDRRSEEHTSELQSRQYLVCRLLLEKKKILIVIFSSDLNLTTLS